MRDIDRGAPTPDNVANHTPRRRILTTANGLLAAGALIYGGFVADAIVRPILDNGLSNSPAHTLVYNYEHTAVTLGKEGKIAQLPQGFDSQQVSAAYKENDIEFNRLLLDVGVFTAGTVVLGAGVLKSVSKRIR